MHRLTVYTTSRHKLTVYATISIRNGINIHHPEENHLVQLVERAVAGEEIIFEHNGKPVAKLVPLKSENHKKPRQGGQWKGKVKIAPDFDELPEAFMAAFRAEKN